MLLVVICYNLSSNISKPDNFGKNPKNLRDSLKFVDVNRKSPTCSS